MELAEESWLTLCKLCQYVHNASKLVKQIIKLRCKVLFTSNGISFYEIVNTLKNSLLLKHVKKYSTSLIMFCLLPTMGKVSQLLVGLETSHWVTIRAGELKFGENLHPVSCVTCNASYFTFQVSGVTCPVSHVWCHMSGVMCQVSGVRCHVSGAKCQVSHVRCHMDFIFIFF